MWFNEKVETSPHFIYEQAVEAAIRECNLKAERIIFNIIDARN